MTYIREDDSSDSKTFTSQKMKQRFKDLMAGKTYDFQVDCGLISQALVLETKSSEAGSNIREKIFKVRQKKS